MSLHPTGTVTFLFTDIEASTRLAHEYPDALPAALARHNAILSDAIERYHGYVFRIVGDAFCAGFTNAGDGLQAALAAERALHAEAWGETPIRARMGLHTGAATLRPDGEYEGYLTLALAQRVMSAGHGGQVLLSNATAALLARQSLAGFTLRDLGEHRLKGLLNPERLWQAVAPDLPAEFPPLQTAQAARTNLPVQLTSFIGREKEIAEAKRLLAETRLLTFTGSGGAGKTRLSLQLAAEQVDTFSDGVWFVELAPVNDPALVVPAIGHVLRLSDSPGTPMLEVLTDYLREQELLLVLDNFEQLVDAAPLLKTLLTSAPKLKVLVTSRTLLRIAGEREYAVPLLALPDPDHLPPLDQLTQYESVRLFSERARAVKSDFVVTNESAPAVAEICYRLDGLPLAIELAAARVRLLPPQKMLAQLDHKLKILVSAARDLPARQQTLRGAIDWSFGLLSPAEQTLFRRLSVFLGGATLEAIEAVCNADADSAVFDLVESLADKSLLKQGERHGDPRFMMLEMVREYAAEKLSAAGEQAQLRDRHLHYFLALSEQYAPTVLSQAPVTGQDAPGLAVLAAEDDNLDAALGWGLERDPALSLRLAGALGNYWVLSGHLTEGRRWLTQTLARVDADGAAALEHRTARGRALSEAGRLANMQGDIGAARPLLEAAIELWRESGDRPKLLTTLAGLGFTASVLDDMLAARAALEEAVALGRSLGANSDLPMALGTLGQVIFRSSRDYAAARPYFEEADQVGRQIGQAEGATWTWNGWGMAAYQAGEYDEARHAFQTGLRLSEGVPGGWLIENMNRSGLADVAWRTSDYAHAELLYTEALSAWRRSGNRGAMARILECLAFVAKARAQAGAGDSALARFRHAVLLLGAADALRTGSGNPMTGPEREEYERELAGVRQALDAELFSAAWADGQRLPLDQVLALALGSEK